MTHFRAVDVAGMKPVSPASQPAPQLGWVKVADIVIDDRYQRPLSIGNLAAIRRIAADFKWSRFSPVLIAPIEGGRYALIDGQHRTHAAALCGFDTVPAMIAHVAPEEQALAFIEINTRQIRVNAHNVYRAALSAGEAWATESRQAVEAAGCQLMTRTNFAKDEKKAGQVFAIELIRKMVTGGHAQSVTEGLAALLAYDPDAPQNFMNAMLTPFLTAVAENAGDRSDWLGVLRARKPWAVIEAADRLAEADGKPKAKCRREFFSVLMRRGVRA